MMRLALLVLALPAGVQAQDIDSVYTSYDWAEDCRTLDQDVPPDAAGMGFRMVCPGPDGMYVMLTDGDARISMDYGSTPDFGPWESFASFSSVHDTVEWRRHETDGTPRIVATIHRWFVGPDPDPREILIVSTAAGGAAEESCMVGVVDASRTAGANTVARKVADARAPGFRCGQDRVRAYGDVGLDTPLPRRAAPSPPEPQ
ncbi:hypothetical protein [Salibaculum halophilum]|uniref:hypothetical protein n=1 Tax=Salibaculum halophilum TaxID=1914408 RepID=UPI000A115CAC|nr:hypothetical protein [Salibaculum halophilum]